MNDDVSFRERYGDWAVICGASEGVGECFARELAQRGLNLLLVSRRQGPLDSIAGEIRETAGVEARTLAADLSRPDAVDRIISATAGLEVGMLIYCAGADPGIKPFRQRSLESMNSLVHRNCLASLALCHHFAPAMEDRGRGGIILLSSGAGLQGIKYLVAYSASKAFDMVMGEALWAELHDSGVDVLSLVLTTTDTPAYRKTLEMQGEDPAAVSGLVPPQLVVEEALANLKNGPTWFVSEQFRQMQERMRGMSRNDVVRAVSAHEQKVTRD